MEDDSKLSYFFLGLGLGVAAGVLFAPKSGAETREFLRSKAEEGGDYVKQQAGNIKETAAEALERSKQTIQKHKDNLASAVEAATGHRLGLGWAAAFQLVNDLGFANVFPVGLARFTRAANAIKPFSSSGFGIWYAVSDYCRKE